MGYEIRIEVDEDTERSLNKLAEDLNLEARVLGGKIIRDHVNLRSIRKNATAIEMVRYWQRVAALEKLARNQGLPSLPDEALTREAMYADHD